MKQRPLGSSGIQASVIGLGTWAIGGWMWGGAEERDSIRAVHAALEQGINLIDTAPVYGFGEAENVLGKALRDRRHKALLASKCGLIWNEERGELFFASDEQGPSEKGPLRVYRCLAPEAIRRDVEQTLKRLKTDYLDLLQTHWQDPTTPIGDVMMTLMALKQEGKIRAIGCCNATTRQMDEYVAAGQLDADQEPFSMLDRRHEKDNLPYCRDRHIAFLAYSPLARGLLTGAVTESRAFSEGDMRRADPLFGPEQRRRAAELLAAIRPVAEKHGLTSAQLALAWTAAQPGCTHVLAGARTARQAEENAKAGDVELGEEDLKLIREALDRLDAAPS